MRREVLGYVLSVLALLVLWQLASWVVHLTLPPRQARVLPGPVEALQVFAFHGKDIGIHALATGVRLTISLLISFILAVPLGLSIGHERWARQLFSPLVYTAYPIPKVVFWPILFVLLGVGSETAKISFVVLVVFFQLLVSARDAAANLPRDYVLSALAAGVSHAKIYWHVVLPGALPAVFTSLRISLGLGIFAVYIAETVSVSGTPLGLGFYIWNSFGRFSFEAVFAGIIAIALLGLGLYLLLEILERGLCRWKYV
jgi:ABC-type nitrate/sulfonate/bicarbonate transport system permease component